MTTFEQLLEKSRKHQRTHNPDREHELQVACVEWFRYQYPRLSKRLFAVPNGGYRDRRTAAKLKDEGVLSGVSDLILLKPNTHFHALLIEMKVTEKYSRQSSEQKEWQKELTSLDEYKYVVCRSIDDFMREVNDYLKDIKL